MKEKPWKAWSEGWTSHERRIRIGKNLTILLACLGLGLDRGPDSTIESLARTAIRLSSGPPG